MTAPATWHHGLVARWWAAFNREGPEIEFYGRYAAAGQPVLDAACGAGRLLVPWLARGIDVDGVDVSGDMLAHCRARIEREGLTPPLLAEQALAELDLPRRYRTIVVCGGFGLGGDRGDDTEALRRLFAHLEPGGLLLLDNEVPYAEPWWGRWPAAGRGELPAPWPEGSDRRRESDTTELELRSRLVALDPLEQTVSLELRAGLFRDGELAAEEEHRLDMTLYFTHELRLMLTAAGFADVELLAGHEERAPTADDETIVFLARRPVHG